MSTQHYKDELCYTDDHEWINLNDKPPIVGIAPFKLIGIPGIEKIQWLGAPGAVIKQNQLIAIIYWKDYYIPVHAPTAGKIIDLNSRLLIGELDLVKLSPENEGWLFSVIPLLHDDDNLLTYEEYASKIQPVSTHRKLL